MTLPTTHTRMDYTGNGATTVYPYTFLILAASDLRIYVNDVLQTLATHYSVSSVGAIGGGNVTFVTAPANGAELVILRAMAQTQPVDLLEGAKLPAETVEVQLFDRVYAVVQDLAEQVKRALKVGATHTHATTEPLVPDFATVAGKAVKVRGDGLGLDTFTVLASDIGSPITTQGDLIRGSAGNAPERLAIGAEGQVPRVVAAQVVWAAPGGAGTPGADFHEYEGIATPATPVSGRGRLYSPSAGSGLRVPAWLDASGQISTLSRVLVREVGAPIKTIVNTTTETSLFTTAPTIKANTQVAGRQMRAYLRFDALNDVGAGQSFTLRLKFGGTTIVSLAFSSWGQSATVMQGLEWNVIDSTTITNHVGMELGRSQVAGSPPTAVTYTVGGSLVNSTADQTLDWTVQLGAANANLFFRPYLILVEAF